VKRRIWRRGLCSLAAVVAVFVLLDLIFPLPKAARPDARDQPEATLLVLAEDGTPLRAWPGRDGALRHPVKIAEVSPLYLQSLLHYEDRWFYWHLGVNPVALARAAWQWARHGRIVSGGSTLTMQVARMIDPAVQGRSVGVKLRQIARALQLEAHLSKAEILTLYLNNAPMGGMVEGVEAASRAYLGKPAKDLSHAEAALLTAMPQQPSRLRPDRAAARAQAARDKVLTRMQDLGVWDAATVKDAKLETVFAARLRAQWLAPIAAERLRQQRKPGEPMVIQSTLDAGMQQRLEQVLLDRLNTLPERTSIAALVVDNKTGAVRGYAGSADFGDLRRASQVDMVRGLRSPGSTLKPFLYAMALDQGLIHSESLLIDAPQNFGGYAPGNFQADFSGPVSVSDALQRSLNVPAVDLLDRVGPDRFAAKLRNAGLRLRMPKDATPNLSLILGGASTNLQELVGAYTALARRGVAVQPHLRPGDPRVETPLMSEGAAFIVREILENGGRPGTPFRESDARIAWKTGTSFGFRDAWAIGVTDRLTLGVWMGRVDGTPNPGYFGANSAAPLLKDLAAALSADNQTAPRHVPASVKAVAICWPLGLAQSLTPASQCLSQRMAWTLGGATPPTLPDRLRSDEGLVETAWVLKGQRVRPDCAGAANVEPIAIARWPTLLQPWIAADQRSPVERLPWSSACAPRSASVGLRVVGIEPNAVLRAAPGQSQVRVRLQAIGAQQGLSWLLNGQLVGQSENANALLELTLKRPGDQTLTVMDGRGRYARLSFELRIPTPDRP